MLLLKIRAFQESVCVRSASRLLSLFILQSSSGVCVDGEHVLVKKAQKTRVDVVMQQCSTQVPRVPRCPLHTAVCRWPPSIAHLLRERGLEGG